MNDTGRVETHKDDQPVGLQRSVGFYGLMFVSLGSIIGSGWLLGALNAAQVAGPASILSWMLAACMGHPDFYRTGPIYPCYLSLQRPKELGDFDIEHLGYEPYMIEELKAKGYDGAITYDKRQIVAFYSSKIKFALSDCR